MILEKIILKAETALRWMMRGTSRKSSRFQGDNAIREADTEKCRPCGGAGMTGDVLYDFVCVSCNGAGKVNI